MRQRATLPRPSDRSTIAATGLSFQVRNGDWASPRCHCRRKSLILGKTRRQPGNRRTDAKKTNTIKPVTTTLHAVDKPLPCFQTESDDLRSLVLVSSTPYDASTSSLSNTCSTCDLSFLEGTRSPHLGDGFPLRCFQRLSDPEVANQPRPWRDDWHTRVPSTPVLSY